MMMRQSSSTSRILASCRHCTSLPHHRFISKLRDTAHEALAGLPSLRGATVAIGGFGPTGVPETLIDALCQVDDAHDLTIVALDVGTDHRGVGKLITAGKYNVALRPIYCTNVVSKIISFFITTGKVRRMIAAYVVSSARIFCILCFHLTPQ